MKTQRHLWWWWWWWWWWWRWNKYTSSQVSFFLQQTTYHPYKHKKKLFPSTFSPNCICSAPSAGIFATSMMDPNFSTNCSRMDSSKLGDQGDNGNNWNLGEPWVCFWGEIDGLWVIKLGINHFFVSCYQLVCKKHNSQSWTFVSKKMVSRQHDRKPCTILRIDMDYRSTATNRETHPVVPETERCFLQPYATIMYYTNNN